jgi:DnaD/phage-associated family protein
MAGFVLYHDNYVDSTVISNRFIDNYMKDANDAQIKVYLYLIRMLNANLPTSISDIADKFNHTEKDIIRALKYWEKMKLLTLEFDREKNLTGVHLKDLPQESLPAAPVITPTAIRTPMVNQETSFGEAVPEATRFSKPSYTTDQLQKFKGQQETAQLLFIVESYVGRPLSGNEIKCVLYFKDILKFSDDLVDYLVQYCLDQGKKDFRYIEKVAVNWAEEGITTPKQAQKHSVRYDKNVYAIMNALGKNTSPTLKELEYINRWIKDYAFTADVIFEACERTVMATDKHRFEYAERILESWKKENVHNKADVYRIDDLYRQRSKTTVQRAGSVNKFNQFTQNSYDFEQLEQELLSN